MRISISKPSLPSHSDPAISSARRREGSPSPVTAPALAAPSPRALQTAFNDVITHLNSAPRSGEITRNVTIPADIFYLWLFRKPSLFGRNPLTYHGIFIPGGSTISLKVTTTATDNGWSRVTTINTPAIPNGLGAWGPFPLSKKEQSTPLTKTRVARLVFSQTLDHAGSVTGEKTELGLTFANPNTGRERSPSRLEKRFLKPRVVPYMGTKLYMVDISKATGEVWAKEDGHLASTRRLHQRETGEVLSPGSTAEHLAFLKYRLLQGSKQSRTKYRAIINRARRALKLPDLPNNQRISATTPSYRATDTLRLLSKVWQPGKHVGQPNLRSRFFERSRTSLSA